MFICYFGVNQWICSTENEQNSSCTYFVDIGSDIAHTAHIYPLQNTLKLLEFAKVF